MSVKNGVQWGLAAFAVCKSVVLSVGEIDAQGAISLLTRLGDSTGKNKLKF